MRRLYYYVIIFFVFIHFLLAVQVKNVWAFELNIDYPSAPDGGGIFSNYSVPSYLKYIFDIGIFTGIILAVVSLAIAGLYYFFSPVSPGALVKAKDRIFGVISGLAILLLAYLIVTTINPSLSFFRLDPLEKTHVETPSAPPIPGVYLYKGTNFSSDLDIRKTSQKDLKDFNNNIRSAKIIHDHQYETYFVGILYESSHFWGRCLYIKPNSPYNPDISPVFASSLSVYEYNHNPSFGGVTFYREAFLDTKGGFLEIPANKTKGIYMERLTRINFMKNEKGDLFDPNNCTVPEEKMECVQWKNDGTCSKRKCPDLSGENIGSIKINGPYVVLFIYFGPGDKGEGPWSSCQAFPTPDDKIGMGPNKIVWENINNERRIPNFVAIIPVKNNLFPF